MSEPSRDLELWRGYSAAAIDLILDLVPVFGPMMRFALRVTETLDVAAHESGVDALALLGAAGDREAFGDLVREALDSASRTRFEEKRRAFGRAIALGYLATDDAAVDAERFLVGTVDVLEAPHIRAMEVLHAQPDRAGPEVLAEAFQLDPEMVDAIIARLEVEDITPNRGTRWNGGFQGLTPYGERVREHLIDAEPG